MPGSNGFTYSLFCTSPLVLGPGGFVFIREKELAINQAVRYTHAWHIDEPTRFTRLVSYPFYQQNK